jgi:hypothetical protein
MATKAEIVSSLRRLWIAAEEFKPSGPYESDAGDNLIAALDEADEILAQEDKSR